VTTQAVTDPQASAQTDTGHPRRWFILGVMVITLVVVVLNNTVLNVALRVLADPVNGLGATQAELEWSINAYTLAFAGLLFTFGVLGDRYGRRMILLLGLAIFGLASVASAYAQDPGQLIAARALTGIGAAAIMPVTLSIISVVFDPRERGRAIGIWTAAVGIAVAIGPVTGGFLLEHFWWGSIFLLNVPVVAFAMVLAVWLVPESRDPEPRGLDLGGMALSVVGLVLLVYGIIDGGEHGFGRPVVWVTAGGGLLVLGLFIMWERRSAYPSLDVSLFRDPRFSTAAAVTALMFFAAFGVFFFHTFYLQLVRDLGPLAAGALLVPFAIAQLIFAPRSAALVRQFGAKATCAVGLALSALSLLIWAFIDVATPLWVVGAAFFLQGMGMAIVMPATMESIMSTLPRERAGVGSAVANTMRQVGGTLGIAVLGAVVMAVYRGRIAPALELIPQERRATAAESIAGAYAVAEEVGEPALLPAADEAFLTAMQIAAGASAVVALLAVLVVMRWLPGRPEPAVVPAVRPQPELAGSRTLGSP
jgi:MFS transporter, DHA2 family, multidrug resistance protein